jgi:ribosome modulation factor
MTPHEYPTDIETQVLFLDVLARVTAEGWRAGRDLGSYAGDCPYSGLLVPLRDAWLYGFSAGRAAR